MATVAYVGRLEATPAARFTGTTIALGLFDDINAMNHQVLPDEHGRRLLKNLHPGHSLIIVTADTVTAYEGDDPTCKPHVYTQGMGFVDEGGDHVHLIRNETSVEAKTVAVQLIPAGATSRVDAEANPACSF